MTPFKKITRGGNGKDLGETDEDVAKEADRIAAMDVKHTDEVMVTRNLSKIYNTRTGRLQAVSSLSIGIPAGECFGLLGINGAGKTTAFKMLTGDESISGGECYVNGYSLLKPHQRAKAQQCVGYCPQFDALISSLTGRETLEFFCDLRGLSKEDRAKSVDTVC